MSELKTEFMTAAQRAKFGATRCDHAPAPLALGNQTGRIQAARGMAGLACQYQTAVLSSGHYFEIF